MIFAPNDFPFEVIKKRRLEQRPTGNRGTTSPARYKNLVCAFDIETTRIKPIEQSIMYVWQFQIAGYTVIGRTWDEFLEFCTSLCEQLDKDEYICVYVHNLSYEFQFLRGIYPFESREVFAIKSRRVIKCTMFDHLEFRCSYALTNMGLAKFLKEMDVEHQKVDGDDFDYDKPRYPWTPLTDLEMEYCVNDVLGLTEAIKVKLSQCRDTLHTIPMTSTGYVRRDTKKVMGEYRNNIVKGCLPNPEIYRMLREAFRGGNTHANRYYVGDTVHNVHSFDRSSSYPDVLVHCDFPVGEFQREDPKNRTYDRMIKLITVRKRAVLARIGIHNIRLRDQMWPFPYVSKDRCRNVHGATIDNGRILEAEYMEITVTDVDLRIILEEYEFDGFDVIDLASARYGKLPDGLRKLIIKYYKDKTELKNVPGRELDYALAKALLNSIYGMMAQDPVRYNVTFDHEKGYGIIPPDVEAQIEKNNRRAFLSYAWGVWCTAWARYRLEEGFHVAGLDCVYTDTDSVKYVGEADWSEFNAERIAACMESGAYATDPAGEVHYMGVFEEETPEAGYFEFKTLGAKKYAYRESEGGKLHITVAGVNKKKGAAELERAGGLDAFAIDFTFVDGGGVELVYNDNPEIRRYPVEGREVEITANVVIRPSTYTIGITDEFAAVVENSHMIKKVLDKRANLL